MTSINTPQEALAKLSDRSTPDLIRDFVLTGKIVDRAHATKATYDPNLYTVRGWIMDELERRDPKGFEAWLDSNDGEPALPRYITC